ncbi:integrase catalytic domain-containing protein [Nephila pilipes]|uniref:Integrase catalytic domain-containing protein n=1 Tax=Nephila pilipes TaxID=299642 RepID=A0A8X6URU0_NEPPI|nr:integrase catalytic domain-containing protein [Nephila pilipes]
MSKGCFNLMGWESNVECKHTSRNSGDTSVLGIIWNLDKDTLKCKIDFEILSCGTKINKRLILSTVQKLYDPIGVFTPTALLPKLIIQDLWKSHFSWDEESVDGELGGEESNSNNVTDNENNVTSADAVIVRKFTSSGRPVKAPSRLDLLNNVCYILETLSESKGGGEDVAKRRVYKVAEVDNFVEKAQLIMSKGCFNLMGWESNVECKHTSRNSGDTSVLGIIWNLDKDTLKCKIDFEILSCGTKINKRLILSTVQKLYDHIGVFTPTALLPKLIIQDLWKSHFSWDEVLPPSVVNRFSKWLNEMYLLKDVTLSLFL